MLFSCSIGAYAEPRSFCNPLDLNYRFMSDARDAREAADPVIALFKDSYYLFASRSGGFWVSDDLVQWRFVKVTSKQLPIIEDYAPAVLVMGDSLYYTASASGLLYSTADPESGIWVRRAVLRSYGDPALFLDDDGRLYMYYGVSNVTPTYGVELDPRTFAEIGKPVEIVHADAANHGWERRGDDNLLDEKPWIEGSWMIKQGGKYYLQYAGPGTEFKTYADGINVADAPLGPFEYAPYSPFSSKPSGFIAGAGHGCTFQDKAGNWWRVVTMTISVKHMFERRLGLFPVGFDAGGHIFCNTLFSDYPQFVPGIKAEPAVDNFAGWMLLTRQKKTTASSCTPGYDPANAADEDARTYWAAAGGNPGEWLQIDLGMACTIHAFQINLAEHDTDPDQVRGRDVPLYERYTLETSLDGVSWAVCLDLSENSRDIPHAYFELKQPVIARYLRLTNLFTAGGGKFAVRDLRAFGNPQYARLTPVSHFTVERDAADDRNAVLRWSPVEGADGYAVRFGVAPDKLYNSFLVYDADSLALHCLDRKTNYYFSVEAFDSGTDYYRGPNRPIGGDESGQLPSTLELGQNSLSPFQLENRCDLCPTLRQEPSL